MCFNLLREDLLELAGLLPLVTMASVHMERSKGYLKLGLSGKQDHYTYISIQINSLAS